MEKIIPWIDIIYYLTRNYNDTTFNTYISQLLEYKLHHPLNSDYLYKLLCKCNSTELQEFKMFILNINVDDEIFTNTFKPSKNCARTKRRHKAANKRATKATKNDAKKKRIRPS